MATTTTPIPRPPILSTTGNPWQDHIDRPRALLEPGPTASRPPPTSKRLRLQGTSAPSLSHRCPSSPHHPHFATFLATQDNDFILGRAVHNAEATTFKLLTTLGLTNNDCARFHVPAAHGTIKPQPFRIPRLSKHCNSSKTGSTLPITTKKPSHQPRQTYYPLYYQNPLHTSHPSLFLPPTTPLPDSHTPHTRPHQPPP